MSLRINQREIDRMILLFIDHRGNKKSLSKDELFKEWFNEEYDETDATKMYNNRAKWSFLRRMMKWMRKKSPYFVINRHTPMGHRYYLVMDEEDGRPFNDHLESIVKGIRHVQSRYKSYLHNSIAISMAKKRKKRMMN